VSQPSARGSDDEPTFPPYDGPAFFSFGFRPFFLGAAFFAGIAVPVWILILVGSVSSNFLYAPREWHVHEMLFGFLPAVMTGFLLTAIPNWTGRAPLRGVPLVSLWVLWLAGRLLVAAPAAAPFIAAVVDGIFLVVLAAVIWREIATAKMWSHSPIVLLISLYAGAHIWFQVLALRGAATDMAERVALSIILLLLTIIGGRVTPAFTRDYLAESRMATGPASFSRFDGLCMLLVLIAAVAWIIHPEGQFIGILFIVAALANLIRLLRWQGWMVREPLVFILHLGYGWVALSLLAFGEAIFGALSAANAVHVLTSGAVGTMTLAVMTRASLGHTGRARHADFMTVVIYVLVNLGAVVRVLTPTTDAATGLTNLLLGAAALGWSGAYLLFALVYGPILVRPSLQE
jgi:uncharacterized protein involved in response to NO